MPRESSNTFRNVRLRSFLSPAGVVLIMLCAVMSGMAQQPVLVSAANADVATGARRSYRPSVSADGRYVAFQSFADNLVPQRDLNDVSDIFVRDLQTGTTRLVSINSAGTDTGNRESNNPVISPDGRYVVFQSDADDLAAGDTNFITDVYVRDLQTNTTVLVSRNMTGTGSGNGSSFTPIITPDGRFVAYQSSASNLVPNDTNNFPDVFVRDLQTNTTKLVSVNHAGTASGNGSSIFHVTSTNTFFRAAMSADGRYVVFESTATDLASVTDTNNTVPDVFVRDLQTNTTQLVSVNSAGTGSAMGGSILPVISPDGRYVVFLSLGTNLVSVSDSNDTYDLFRRDLQTGTTALISFNSAGTAAAGITIGLAEPVMSADGRHVAFTSAASGFVANDTNDKPDVFVRDMVQGTTTLASVDQTNSTTANGISNNASLSADGRFIAFQSTATNLVATPDANNPAGVTDVFVRDLQTNTTTLASVNNSGAATGNKESMIPVLSSDGGIVVFDSAATNLASIDGNDRDDVFAVALLGQAKFSSPQYMIDEQNGTATVTVTRNASSTGPLAVKLFTGNGSATGGADFTVIDQTLSFAAGETSKNVVIPIVNDTTDEVSETVNLIVSDFSSSGQPKTLSTATLIINDEDPPPSLSIDDVTITESDFNTVNAVFKVSLSEASGQTILVDVTPAAGTATQFTDFHIVPTKLIIPAGSAFKEIAVTISGDLTDEFDETFTMTLSNPIGASIARAQGTGTIVDNDAPPALTITDATRVEGNTGTTEIIFTVRQSVASSKTVTVNYTTADFMAAAGSDYTARSGTLTFDPGQRTKAIIVPILGDTAPEADEVFFVNLSDPTNSTIEDNQGRGTITNDDGSLPVLSLNGVIVAEGNTGTTNAVVTVTLSAASTQTVTATYETFAGTATSGVDYQPVSGTLIFNPGVTTQTINIPVIGDTVDEQDETFRVQITHAVNASFQVSSNPPSVRITDDDGAMQAEIKTWTQDGRTYAHVKLIFEDNGYRVTSWGQISNIGPVYSADASIQRLSGPLVQAVMTTVQIFDLGALPDGNYTFVFKNGGAEMAVKHFTVTNAAPAANPIDTQREFVRWQYKDFLGREPDGPGWDFWTANITKCNDPAQRQPGQTLEQCIDFQRTTTSAAFFLSPEFQYTGYFIYRIYKGALGRAPYLSEFTPDQQQVGTGIIVNDQLSAAKINQNKLDFANQFVQRAEFKALYDGLNNELYVDRLFRTTNVAVSAADKQSLVNALNNQTETRTSVLFKIVDGINIISEGSQQFTTTYGKAFYDAEVNNAFVQMEYFGYMRRDPDGPGYTFWLLKLNQYGNYVDAEMVRSFVVSPEYRSRFGQP